MRGGGKMLNRGGGKFLRKDADFDSDSEEDDDDSSSSEAEETSQPMQPSNTLNGNDNANSNANSNSNANLSSSEEESDNEDDEESEEEDESEEEEEVQEQPKKRKASPPPSTKKSKKKKTNTSFFDEYAEEADEDLEEEYGTHHDPDDVVKKRYTEDDIRRENMDSAAQAMIEAQNRRRKNMSKFSAYDADVSQITQQIEERHMMNNRSVSRRDMDGPAASGEGGAYQQDLSAVSQQSLLPSTSDPSLWMFTCANGKEQEMVYQVMNKCIAHARLGKPLGITSAVAAQSKGKIYIESFNEPAVLEACSGIRGLMIYTKRLVPISDMTTVMTVQPKKKPVKKDDWVRMTRGHYKGDLAIVKFVRDSGLKCIVQTVPRIDLTLSDLPPEEARIRKRTVRPPQKFFNEEELKNLGKDVTRMSFPNMSHFRCDNFENNFYHDGYLLKEVTVGTMIRPCGEEEPPTLDELQRFRNRTKGREDDEDEDDEENEGSRRAKSLLEEITELQGKTSLAKSSSNTGGLLIGDTIEVVEGDLVGMRGKILSLDGSTVKMKPLNADDLATNEVEFLISQVKKHIEVGAHVKVIDGRYANETGTVVAVEQLDGDSDSTAVILTDMTNKEVSVRISQLQESAEVASGQDKLAGYELHDLVVLTGGGSNNEVGVIVRIGREEFTVINNHGIVREVRPEELRGKRNSSSNRAIGLDVQGNQIRVGDTVEVTEGPHKNKSATIKRMNRAQLFLYSQTRTENAGIFVVRSRSCVLSGSRVQRNNANDGGASPYSTPRSQSSGGGAAGRGRKDDGLIGKTVRIQSGNWKGYLGTVCDATPTHVQVELHSRLKKVMVVRERVAVVGDKFGATEDPNRMNNGMLAPTTPFVGGQTPMHGGQTPMHGGMTPMHGSATPLHDGMGGGFTPSHSSGTDDVWRPGGSIDRPAEENGDDGWGASDASTKQEQSEISGSDPGEWGSTNDQGGEGTWAPSTSDTGPSDPLASSVKSEDNDATKNVGVQQGEISASTMGAADGEEAPVWFMERVCVTLRNGGASGVVKEINDNIARVECEDGTMSQLSPSDVIMVAPKEHDIVLVTGGADVGVEGELVCIDGTDAILKDSNEDFKIVDLVHLAKIVGDA